MVGVSNASRKLLNSKRANSGLSQQKEDLSEVETIQIEMSKLMKQLSELKVNRCGNPEDDNQLLEDSRIDGADILMDKAQRMILLKQRQQEDKSSLAKEQDLFSEMLATVDFSDYKDSVIDEADLLLAFPTSCPDRVKLERKF